MSPPIQRIALIGPRGAGKSAIGKRLAARLGWEWRDVDRAVEQAAGLSIPEIFARKGEAAFRAVERAQLSQWLEPNATTQVVISTGGGAVLEPAARERLRSGAYCIWLDAPVPVLAERLRRETNRPSLTGIPVDAEIEAVVRGREPLYAAVAHERVESAGDLEAVVESIVMRLAGRLQACACTGRAASVEGER